MNSRNVFYTKGYKYRTSETIVFQTILRPEKEICSETGMIILTREGLLIILKGYSSDGPSGFTIDTETFMAGAFGHDAWYQLLREDKFLNLNVTDELGRELSESDLRYHADLFLKKTILKNGMNRFRANYVYYAVRNFGLNSATIKRKIYKA